MNPLRGAVVLIALACPLLRGQSPEATVTAAYKSLEKAVREGDAESWLHLQSRETLASMSTEMQAAIRNGSAARPNYRSDPLAVRAQGNEAVVIGKVAEGATPHVKYHWEYLTFVLEDGEWKVAAETSSDRAIDPVIVCALLPPTEGAFRGAGSPWTSIPLAGAELPWKIQATQDNAALYVRFVAASPLPAPGLEIQVPAGMKFPDTGAPPNPPWMRIKIAAPGPNGATTIKEFEFQAAAVLQTRSTFDSTGNAAGYRYFVQYSLLVTRARQGLGTGTRYFESNTSDAFNPVVAVHGPSLEFQIPLQALGIPAARSAAIQIEDTNSPPRFQPYRVAPFRQ